MKTIFRSAAAAVIAATAFGAKAADLPSSKAPPPAPIFVAYDWTGFYVGAHAGYGWSRLTRTTAGVVTSTWNGNGFLGGVHLGYNYQIGSFVLGAEGDISYATVRGNDGGQGGVLDANTLRWMGSIRARFGVAFDRLLVYATGGWAFANTRHVSTAPLLPSDVFTASLNGWTIGAGLEYAMTNNWILRGEYRYANFGRVNRTPAAAAIQNPFTLKVNVHTVRVGLSYKF